MGLDAWIRANVSGIVLNGGESVRFGRDKAWERLAGRTLIERVLDTLGSLFGEVLVVGRPEAAPAHPAVTEALPDAVPGVGPLGGICTGLEAMSRPVGFFAACDMPWLDADVIRRQLALVREGHADAVVPRWDGYWEPLHAAYAVACLPAARDQLARCDYRIRSFFGQVRVRFWDIRAEGLSTRPFANVNTRNDLATLLEADG